MALNHCMHVLMCPGRARSCRGHPYAACGVASCQLRAATAGSRVNLMNRSCALDTTEMPSDRHRRSRHHAHICSLCSGGRKQQADTLVLYVFSDSDPEYRHNLEFFVRFGIAAGDGCDYVIVVQQVVHSECTQANACACRMIADCHHVHVVSMALEHNKSVQCFVAERGLRGLAAAARPHRERPLRAPPQ
jgi:hypothetical protein